MANIINGSIFTISSGFYMRLSVSYDYRRSGSTMQYNIYYTLWVDSNSWYRNNLHVNMYLNGGHVYSTDHKSSSSGWSFSGGTGWIDVYNKVSGTTPFSITVQDTQNSSWCNYNSGTHYLDIVWAGINTYESLKSKTANSIVMNWSASSNISGLWYTLNGGGWNGTGVGSGSSGTYTISGLSPNTTYSIVTVARRSDTGVDGYSGSISVTTYKAYSTVASCSVGDLLPFTCTAYCTSSNTSNTSTYEYAICDMDKNPLQTYTSGATYYNFSSLSEETPYYLRCRVQSKDSGVWSDYVYSDLFTTPADQSKGYIKKDSTWQLGKVYLKKDDTWVKVKKTYLKKDATWKISNNP